MVKGAIQTAALLILCLVFSSGCASNALPRPFFSDGCSFCPDGKWNYCCVNHDLAYWKGGTMRDRWKADVDLYHCVRNESNVIWAGIMFIGVRIGGCPYWPFSWRWGFAWRYPAGYGPLSHEERLSIDEVIDDMKLLQDPGAGVQSDSPR